MNKISISFDFDCASPEEQILLKSLFEAQGMSVAANGLNLKIEGDKSTQNEIKSKREAVEAATEDWKTAALALKCDFEADGSVLSDVSEDYPWIDIRIEYHNNTLRIRYSDCYNICFMSDYEEYDDFCDEFGDDVFTEEEFEEIRDEDMFIVEEDGEGHFVDEVPLKYTL